MKNILLYFGSFLGVVALILLISPQWFVKLNKMGDKVIVTDSDFFSKPKLSGVLFIVLGIVLLYMGSIMYNYRDVTF